MLACAHPGITGNNMITWYFEDGNDTTFVVGADPFNPERRGTSTVRAASGGEGVAI